MRKPRWTYDLGGYRVEVSFDELFGQRSKSGYGIIMTDGPDKFLGAGCGFRATFLSKTRARKSSASGASRKVFRDDVWVPGRRLNGDETSGGVAWRFSSWKINIEKCRVYKYE